MVINSKVAIIGDGMVGSSIAFSLMQGQSVSNIVIIDVNKSKAEGDVLDMQHGMPFVSPKRIKAGDYEDIKDAHIIILTAGVAQKPGETRLELLSRNVKIFDSIVESMRPYLDTKSLIMVVTNPCDVLAYYVYKKLNIEPRRVFASGTVLDTARLKSSFAQALNVDSRNVHTFVLGEHGDSEVAIYSQTYVGGVHVFDYCEKSKTCNCTINELMDMHKSVKRAAYDIIEKKGATYYAIALSISEICKAIIQDAKSVLTVSTYIDREFNGRISDVFMSLPCIVGKDGVEDILHPNYSREEVEKLINSAEIIKGEIDSFK